VGYFKKTVTGVGWAGALRGSTRLISFGKNILLARVLLLTPGEFGLYGIALLVLALLEILTETGINVVLIQEREEVDDYLGTAWLVSILRGGLIGLAIFLSARVVAGFFRAPGAVELLVLMSLVPLLRGFINPAVVKLEKELMFRRDFWYRLLLFSVDAAVAVGVVAVTGRAIGLVVGNVVGVMLEVILSFWIVRPRPRLEFEPEKARKIIRRGKWMTGAGVFQYLFRQGDDMVVGRIFGSVQLGFYQMAYRIATMPVTEVAEVVGKVTFPVYTKISGEKVRLRRALMRTTIVTGGLAGVMGVVVMVFAGEVVGILLGENWMEIVPVVRVIVLYAVVRAAINPCLTAFLALQKQEYVTVVTLMGILGMAGTIFPLAWRFGVVGVAYATVVGVLASVPFVLVYLGRELRA